MDVLSEGEVILSTAVKTMTRIRISRIIRPIIVLDFMEREVV
jgi:hypothetical protein